jgi:predicted transcriptional regulator
VFCEPGNSRTEARARRSVQELVELGLVQDRGGNGSIFSVTDEGFGAADLIEKLRKSAV